jgi:hypothetical protein
MKIKSGAIDTQQERERGREREREKEKKREREREREREHNKKNEFFLSFYQMTLSVSLALF